MIFATASNLQFAHFLAIKAKKKECLDTSWTFFFVRHLNLVGISWIESILLPIWCQQFLTLNNTELWIVGKKRACVRLCEQEHNSTAQHSKERLRCGHSSRQIGLFCVINKKTNLPKCLIRYSMCLIQAKAFLLSFWYMILAKTFYTPRSGVQWYDEICLLELQ